MTEQPFPTPVSHPRICHACEGTGWQPGQPVASKADGHTVTYSTLESCGHEWRSDDPDCDVHGYDTSNAMTFAEALTRFTHRQHRGEPVDGIVSGLEAWCITPGESPAETPNPTPTRKDNRP